MIQDNESFVVLLFKIKMHSDSASVQEQLLMNHFEMVVPVNNAEERRADRIASRRKLDSEVDGKGREEGNSYIY